MLGALFKFGTLIRSISVLSFRCSFRRSDPALEKKGLLEKKYVFRYFSEQTKKCTANSKHTKSVKHSVMPPCTDYRSVNKCKTMTNYKVGLHSSCFNVFLHFFTLWFTLMFSSLAFHRGPLVSQYRSNRSLVPATV